MLLIILVSMLLKCCQAQDIEFVCTTSGAVNLFCESYTMKDSDSNTARTAVFKGPNTADYAKITGLRLNHPPLHHFLQEVFTLFPNLQGLYVYSSGPVAILPYAFQKAKNLVEFGIECKTSVILSSYVFYGATNLERIELGGILRIDEFAFAGVAKVNYLYIYNSDIGTCPMADTVFESLINLNYLEFYSTRIKRIPTKLFAKNVKLESIVIWDDVQAVERTFIDNLISLKNISFWSMIDGCGSTGWKSPESKNQFNSDMSSCYANFIN